MHWQQSGQRSKMQLMHRGTRSVQSWQTSRGEGWQPPYTLRCMCSTVAAAGECSSVAPLVCSGGGQGAGRQQDHLRAGSAPSCTGLLCLVSNMLCTNAV